MTTKEATFVARRINAFFKQNFAWWDVDRFPTIKEIVKDLRTNPAAVDRGILEIMEDFNQPWNQDESDKLHSIHFAINHPDVIRMHPDFH